MGKETDFGFFIWFNIFIILCLTTIGISLCLLTQSYTSSNPNKLCEKLGYKEFKIDRTSPEGYDFCSDSNGNLHYVLIYECDFFGDHCKIKQITKGDNTIKER